MTLVVVLKAGSDVTEKHRASPTYCISSVKEDFTLSSIALYFLPLSLSSSKFCIAVAVGVAPIDKQIFESLPPPADFK